MVQAVAYEVIGLCLAVPVYLMFYESDPTHGFLLIASISGVVLLWSPFHNTVFDWVEFRLAHRVASDRPQHWRLVHAFSHETTSMVVTVPILMQFGGHSFFDALVVDIALTVLYIAYAYIFHLVYDHLRPVLADDAIF
jgi:uncharacterized membrane protein